MKRPLTAAVLFATCLTIHAAPAPYPVTINSRAQTAPALLVYRANPVTFRVSFTDGSDASAITDETPFMAWATNALATNSSPASYSIVTATNGTVDFTFSAASVNYAAGRYVYEVGLNTDNGPKTYRQGVFTIQASPAGADVPAVSWTNAVINWGLYGFTGTASNGPVRPDDVTITASNNADGSITLSSLSATPAWSAVTDKPTTFPPYLSATQNIIRASGSGGLVIQNMAGSNVVSFGLADTLNVAFAGGLSVAGNLLVGGTNLLTQIEGKAGTGTVAAIDTRVSAVETGKVDRVSTNGAEWGSHAGFLTSETDPTTTNLLDLAGTRAMQGTLQMGENRVYGKMFGKDAGAFSTGEEWFAGGRTSGNGCSGDDWTSLGYGSGNTTIGDKWSALGHRTGEDAIHTNSHSLGGYSGKYARGDNRLYVDVYTGPPEYAANGATNDMIFGDNGYLYLGRGGGAPGGAQGGTLRGPWTQSALSPVASIATSATNLLSFAGANSISLTGTSARIIGMEIPTASANEGWLSVYVSTTNSVTWLTNQAHLAYSAAPTGRVQTVLYYLPAGSTNITGRVFQ